MNVKIPYLDKKSAIVATLMRCAREGQIIFYGDLGREVGVPAKGPWKAVLDDIARDEISAGRPDLTFLVISKQTGLPGQIGFKPVHPPTPEQQRVADKTIQQVFEFHGK